MLKKVITLIALGFLMSCSILDELTMFNLDYQTNYTFQSTSLVNIPIDILTPDITTNSTTTFEQNDTRADLVESIKLRTLRLTITAPSEADFNFLKDIRIFMDANGLPEVEIAFFIDHVNDNVKVLDLQLIDLELKEYIKKDEFMMRVETVTDEAVTQDIDILVDCQFRVDAKILGV